MTAPPLNAMSSAPPWPWSFAAAVVRTLALVAAFIPENPAMISAFARYANGIAGSEEFMPEDMMTAPDIVVADELKAAGHFLPTCSPKAQEYYTAIWTELQK